MYNTLFFEVRYIAKLIISNKKDNSSLKINEIGHNCLKKKYRELYFKG